jgi:hypothetical protein
MATSSSGNYFPWHLNAFLVSIALERVTIDNGVRACRPAQRPS